ncbi:D-alanyl-D-alanine dipeptidase [Streptomyces sp. TE5632]
MAPNSVDPAIIQEMRHFAPHNFVRCAKDRRFPDNSVDMDTGYDCFDTLSHTLDPRVQGEQRANRLLLNGTLESLGFVNLAEERWHCAFKPEAHPDTCFDFPVSRGSPTGHH